MFTRVRRRLTVERYLASCVGFRSWAPLRLQRFRLLRASPGECVSLAPPDARYPLLCRAHTSDYEVFYQVFIEKEYAHVDPPSDTQLIIDAGANVGYSAAYFLSQFPRSSVICVEPDSSNFQLLARNLAPYGSRVSLRNAALWSHPTEVVMSSEAFRGGREFSRQVRARQSHETTASLPAVDMRTLLADAGDRRISLLKIDIEGAECVVFSRNVSTWIDKVDVLVIELHDDSGFGKCSHIFHEAIAGRGFAIRQHKELTICHRKALWEA